MTCDLFESDDADANQMLVSLPFPMGLRKLLIVVRKMPRWQFSPPMAIQIRAITIRQGGEKLAGGRLHVASVMSRQARQHERSSGVQEPPRSTNYFSPPTLPNRSQLRTSSRFHPSLSHIAPPTHIQYLYRFTHRFLLNIAASFLGSEDNIVSYRGWTVGSTPLLLSSPSSLTRVLDPDQIRTILATALQLLRRNSAYRQPTLILPLQYSHHIAAKRATLRNSIRPMSRVPPSFLPNSSMAIRIPSRTAAYHRRPSRCVLNHATHMEMPRPQPILAIRASTRPSERHS